MIQLKKGHKALRLGRSSEPGFRYFITICGKDKSSLLTNETFASAIQNGFQKAENDKVFDIISYTIMPDHIHLVFRLGSKLSLGKAISRIKSEVSRNLETNSSLWQKEFYDHKLRNDRELYPILHYIFMNPYRKGLIKHDETWPYFRMDEKIWTWFKTDLKKDYPYPEWLG